MEDVEIAAVNMANRVAVTSDNVTLHLATLLDDAGDETDDPQQAVSAVAELPDGSWVCIDLTQFDTVKTN